MKNRTKIFLGLIISALLLFVYCNKEKKLNLFTLEDDKKFGAQLDAEILSKPNEYTVLSRSQYPEAYAYLDNMLNDIISSDDINYRDDFNWKVTIIDDDVLNAFAAPGGYLYFYTGLMKYLDNESDLAGVFAHEVAHADRRHTTNRMTKVYGMQVILSMLVGENAGLMKEIAANMATGATVLAFSRDDEYEADEFSVKYLYDTDIDARGVAGFFEKLEAEAEHGSGTPTFLSTHPSPDNRIEKIHEVWKSLGSKVGKIDTVGYQKFLNSLP